MEVRADDLAWHVADWSLRPGPLYQRLADALAAAMEEGRIPAGSRLPPERVAGARLNMSRTTVTQAYGRLKERGWVSSTAGSGTTVRHRSQTWVPKVNNPKRPVVELSALVDDSGDAIDLRTWHLSDPGLEADLRRELAAAVEAAPLAHHPHGAPPLRAVLAERYAALGVPTEADQLMITCGGQQALTVTLLALVTSRALIAVENPTSLSIRRGIDVTGRRPLPVPIVDGGIDLSALERLVAHGTAPDLVIVRPTAQDPTGVVMDADRRWQLASWAHRHGVWVLEDLRGFDLARSTPMPLCGHTATERVLSFGSASAVLGRRLELGWLRAAPSVLEALVRTRLGIGSAPSAAAQLALATLLASDPQLAATRALRVAKLVEDAADDVNALMPTWRVAVPPAGPYLWADVGPGLGSVTAAAARQVGVLVVSGEELGYYSAGADHIRIAAVDDARVGEACRRLASITYPRRRRTGRRGGHGVRGS